MGIVVDILLGAVIVLFIYLSSKKGLVITLLEIVAFVLAIFLAAQCALPVAKASYTAFVETSVQKAIYSKIPEDGENISYADKAQYTFNGIPDFAKDYAKASGISTDTIKEKIVTSNFLSDGKLYATLEREIVKPIALSVLKSIWFFVLSILFAFILRFVAKSINRYIKKSKVLGPVNSILGGAFGVVKGLVVVFLLCCFLTYIQPQINNAAISTGITDSFFVQQAKGLDPLEQLSAALLLS